MEAVVRDETLCLTQKAMAQLFVVQVPAISKHLKNIYAEGELLERIRSIRARERRIWQQITDIFAECSLDYYRI